MENLNAEQIIKALECCHTDSEMDCRDCPYMSKGNDLYVGCVNTLVKDALSLIKQLTEENERLRADNLYGLSASKLAKKVEELSYENERLRNRVVCKVVIPDEKLEEIKNECLERVELDVKAVKSETLEDIKIRFAMRFGTYTDKDMTPIVEVFRLLDQIAKEILEGINEKS